MGKSYTSWSLATGKLGSSKVLDGLAVGRSGNSSLASGTGIGKVGVSGTALGAESGKSGTSSLASGTVSGKVGGIGDLNGVLSGISSGSDNSANSDISISSSAGNAVKDGRAEFYERSASSASATSATSATSSASSASSVSEVSVSGGSAGSEASARSEVGSSSGGVMSYADYLKSYGVGSGRAYSSAVRQANGDYYRALVSYGKNAEALNSMGLSGGGISDYGAAAAYAARQGAVSEAWSEKLESDAALELSFAQYLKEYDAELSEKESELKKNAASLYGELISSGLAASAAEAAVDAEYGEGSGGLAREEAEKITLLHDSAAVDSMLSGNYSPLTENQYTAEYFKKQAASGGMSEDAASELADRISSANLSWARRQLEGAMSDRGIDDVLVSLGLYDDYGSLDLEDKAIAVTSALNGIIESLVRSGELSDDDAASYYADYFASSFESGLKAEEYLQTLAQLSEDAGYLDSFGDVYSNALERVLSELKFDAAAIDYTGSGALHSSRVSFGDNSGALIGDKLFIELKDASKSEADALRSGQVTKLGAFEADGKVFVLYDGGSFSVRNKANGRIKYFSGARGGRLRSHGIDGGMSSAASALFERWLYSSCGAT